MNTTLTQLLKESVRRYPRRAALRLASGSVSYEALDERVERLATVLREHGGGGRRVGILLPNTPAFPAALHAIFRSGSSALLLNPANSAREIREQIADAGVTQLFTSERLASLLPKGSHPLLLSEDGEPHPGPPAGSADNVSAAAGAAANGSADPDAEAVVIFTSALEGRARGAVLTHRNLVANLRATVAAMGMKGEDVVHAALPFSHAFGLTVCLNAPLSIGASIVPVARFSPAAVLEQWEELGVTVIAGVPSMFFALNAVAAKRGLRRSSLRVALCGGAPLPLGTAREWEERFGLPLRQGYGLTEAAPVCLFNHVDRPNRIGALGEPLSGVEVSVRGPTGEELAEGEVGELFVRGENVFRGYLDEAGSAGRPPGEWLGTGDLVSRKGGVVRFRGTLRPMFTRNGFNVYPEEVRRVLLEDARFAAVRVLARSDPVREHEIVLEVEPAAQAGLDEAEVRRVCSERLAGYKQPALIRILNRGR